MMEEVTSEEQVTSKLQDTKIASELQEAALTDVTQALIPQKEGTPPRTSFAPVTTSSPPLSTLPPPSELPAHLLSSPGGVTSLPPSMLSSPGGSTTLTPSMLSSPGGTTTQPPSMFNSPGGTTSFPPSMLSSPGGTTTQPPSMLNSPGGTTALPPSMLSSPGGATALPPSMLSSQGGATSSPPSMFNSPGGTTSLPPSMLSSPGGPTTQPPSMLSSPGGTTALPPSMLNSPGGTTTQTPSMLNSPRGVTLESSGVGTLTPSAQTSSVMTPGGAVGVSPPPTGGFISGKGRLSSTLGKQNLSPVGGNTSAMFTPSSITTLPSVGSSPSSESSTVLHPSAYPGTQQGAAQYTVAPDMMQTPIEASSSIDLQDQSLGPMYPAPTEARQGGLFGWLSGRNIVSKVMEKTKSSVETMITTLDPGMKEVIYSGGDVNVLVTSAKEVKVAAVRQAFQEVFGRATITGVDSQPGIAPQPVGFTAGVKGAEDRIDNLRLKGHLHEKQVTISMESFIAEVQPDKWFDIGCVLLRDPTNNIQLDAFTQATPVPLEYVERAQEQTPSDYGLGWSGLSVTVGQVINQQMPYVSPADWHQHFTGVPRREMFYLTTKSIAGMYKERLPFLPQGGATR